MFSIEKTTTIWQIPVEEYVKVAWKSAVSSSADLPGWGGERQNVLNTNLCTKSKISAKYDVRRHDG